MRAYRLLQLLFGMGTLLAISGIWLSLLHGPYSLEGLSEQEIAQNVNNYLGPHAKVVGAPHLVRVQLLIYDDPDPKGVQIVNVQFDHQNVPLKPRDIFGFRGQASFQVKPHRYLLRWTVQRDALNWPRTETHEELLTIDPRDLWIQINISGNSASIS